MSTRQHSARKRRMSAAGKRSKHHKTQQHGQPDQAVAVNGSYQPSRALTVARASVADVLVPRVLAHLPEIRSKVATPTGDKSHLQAATLVREYLRFLELKILHRDVDATVLSPSHCIDEVWHLHLLDTRRYSEDVPTLAEALGVDDADECQVHHDPDAALTSQRLRSTRRAATMQRYVERFGSPLSWAVWQECVLAQVYPEEEEKVIESFTRKGRAASPVSSLSSSSSVRGFVYVTTLTGKKITVDFDPADLLSILKQRVQDKEGIPPAQQRVIFRKELLLDDDVTLGDYGITHGATLFLQCRLMGC